MTVRNPPWSRDELIITLDFYVQHAPTIPRKTSSEIAGLSQKLNDLQKSIGGDTPDKFRNINGVYMKLMNFRRFDPDYKGKGLDRGNKDEEVVWKLYASRPSELKAVANAILSFANSGIEFPTLGEGANDEEEAEEGRILTKTHQYHERNRKLVKSKKDKVFGTMGSLCCEVCGFNFSSAYGTHGDGFIECHHTKPVSELNVGDKTNLSDLTLVCSNCHRMIHRKRPWLSVRELKAKVTRC